MWQGEEKKKMVEHCKSKQGERSIVHPARMGKLRMRQDKPSACVRKKGLKKGT